MHQNKMHEICDHVVATRTRNVQDFTSSSGISKVLQPFLWILPSTVPKNFMARFIRFSAHCVMII